jgi:hypothetical protein
MATKKFATKKAADVAPLDEGPVETPAIDRSARTVNGRPIPPELLHAIPYENTDQGIAEKQARLAAEGRLSPHRVEFTRDAWDAQLDGLENFESPDAHKEGILRVARPEGKSFRYLSDKVIEKRGMRGWEFEEDAQGKRIVVGGLALASMPERRAEKRNAHYREQGNAALREAHEHMTERMERTIQDAGIHGQGFSPLQSGDVVHDRLNPEQAASIGVAHTRGL